MRYASFIWSKVTARADGSFMSGEIDSVRLVGPSDPATKRGLCGVFAVYSSQAWRASRAPATLMS